MQAVSSAVALRGRWSFAIPAGVTMLALAGPAAAQTEPDEPGDAVNYPFFAESGSDGIGSYSIGDRQVRQLTIRPRPLLRSPWDNSFGLRMRITATIGFVEFDDVDELIDSFTVGAIVPGIEILFALSRRSLIYPFLDIGIGSNTSESAAAFVGATGVAGEFVFPVGNFELGLEPSAQLALSRSSEENLERDFGGLFLRSDLRLPLPFNLLGERAEIGGYGTFGWYAMDVEFEDPDGGVSTVNTGYEIGALLGWNTRPKVLFVRLPRIGVGYRFGDGFSSFRIVITGDRLTRLVRD